jgi:hypothetical protein
VFTLQQNGTMISTQNKTMGITVAVVAASGAERKDPIKIDRQGLSTLGPRHLSLNPPEGVLMIDADCTRTAGTVERHSATRAITHRPVQALYLMTAPVGSPGGHQVTEFALRVKNCMRLLRLLPAKWSAPNWRFHALDVICAFGVWTL